MLHQLRPCVHGHAIFWHLLSCAIVNRYGSSCASDNRCIATTRCATQPSACRHSAPLSCGADRQVFYRARFPPIVSLTTHVQTHRRDFLWRRWKRIPLLRRRVSDDDVEDSAMSFSMTTCCSAFLYRVLSTKAPAASAAKPASAQAAWQIEMAPRAPERESNFGQFRAACISLGCVPNFVVRISSPHPAAASSPSQRSPPHSSSPHSPTHSPSPTRHQVPGRDFDAQPDVSMYAPATRFSRRSAHAHSGYQEFNLWPLGKNRRKSRIT